MKITPGLVGEKPPLVLCEPNEFADMKIGFVISEYGRDIFQIQKLKSCTVIRRSG